MQLPRGLIHLFLSGKTKNPQSFVSYVLTCSSFLRLVEDGLFAEVLMTPVLRR